MEKQRLQKVLAQAGFGSRREIETWISAGRVTLNGKPASLGDKAGPFDKIKLDGRLLRGIKYAPQQCQVMLYNKPEGQVCTRSDPEGRDTVFQHLPKPRSGRWIMVGRLDLNTSGLLLFTNDGELAKRLMHPSYQVEREYAVRILGVVTDSMIETLISGVQLEDGPARFKSVKFSGGSGANKWFSIVLTEGRQREVRRLWEAQGLTVSRLIRTRFGAVRLPRNLRLGKTEFLTEKRIQQLMQTVKLSKETK